jgi:hypothetical protein
MKISTLYRSPMPRRQVGFRPAVARAGIARLISFWPFCRVSDNSELKGEKEAPPHQRRGPAPKPSLRHHGKGSKGRVVPLPSCLVEPLHRQLVVARRRRRRTAQQESPSRSLDCWSRNTLGRQLRSAGPGCFPRPPPAAMLSVGVLRPLRAPATYILACRPVASDTDPDRTEKNRHGPFDPCRRVPPPQGLFLSKIDQAS